jgi:peptidoglycan/xylan/chitin deacetylase (PgdA/CDA1 family)
VDKKTPMLNNGEPGAEDYKLRPEQFRKQMEYLKQNGYRAVTLADKQIFDRHDIILTFDDGEHNNFEYAFPILRELGIKAYFFVAVKNIGKQGYMSLHELNKLKEAGMIIGSQGLNNEVMVQLLDTQIEEELRASKAYLERNLNMKITDFSVPRDYVNDKIISIAKEQGYAQIFVAKRPKRVVLPCLGRVDVRAGWSLKRFARIIEGYEPVSETFTDAAKSAAKLILSDNGYYVLRRFFNKLFK